MLAQAASCQGHGVILFRPGQRGHGRGVISFSPDQAWAMAGFFLAGLAQLGHGVSIFRAPRIKITPRRNENPQLPEALVHATGFRSRDVGTMFCIYYCQLCVASVPQTGCIWQNEEDLSVAKMGSAPPNLLYTGRSRKLLWDSKIVFIACDPK
jgi:hypothetical protein